MHLLALKNEFLDSQLIRRDYYHDIIALHAVNYVEKYAVLLRVMFLLSINLIYS